MRFFKTLKRKMEDWDKYGSVSLMSTILMICLGVLTLGFLFTRPYTTEIDKGLMDKSVMVMQCDSNKCAITTIKGGGYVYFLDDKTEVLADTRYDNESGFLSISQNPKYIPMDSVTSALEIVNADKRKALE